MSKTTPDTEPVIVTNVFQTPDAAVETVEKPNLVRRGVNFVKRHKKASIAVASLGTLVVASALIGRKDDSSDTTQPLELEGTYVPASESIVENDTTVA